MNTQQRTRWKDPWGNDENGKGKKWPCERWKRGRKNTGKEVIDGGSGRNSIKTSNKRTDQHKRSETKKR
jgi:hypothetical protein